MEFFNPNVAAEMVQLLKKNYQEKYVPCFGAKVLSKVLVHGDQSFEERGRNIQWTFRDREDPYEWRAYVQSMLTRMLPSHCTR